MTILPEDIPIISSYAKREEGRDNLEQAYAIEMLHITKRFPGIVANDDITLQLKKGEIHALLGENGAGKSTLMSVLFGLYQPEEGIIKKDGQVVQHQGSRTMPMHLGIGMVHQHFKLVECFSVLDNIILGVEPMQAWLPAEGRRPGKRCWPCPRSTAWHVDPDALVEDITVGMQQRTEILKMLYRDNEILIFDEPTAVLTPQEIDELMQIMKNLAAEGKSHPLYLPQAQRDHGGGRPLHRPAQGQVHWHCGNHQGPPIRKSCPA